MITKQEIRDEMDLIADLEASSYIEEKLEGYIFSAVCSYVDMHFRTEGNIAQPGVNAFVQSNMLGSEGIAPLVVDLSIQTGANGIISFTAIKNRLLQDKPLREVRFVYDISVRPKGAACEFFSATHRSMQNIRASRPFSLLAPTVKSPAFYIDNVGYHLSPERALDATVAIIMQPLPVTDTQSCELPHQTLKWIAAMAVFKYAVGTANPTLAGNASTILTQLAV